MKTNRNSGFTVIEIIVAIAILIFAGMIFVLQKRELSAEHRDMTRKIAVNAIYYNLEEIVKPSLGGYPEKLEAKQLKAMDKELLKDPKGLDINQPGSNYKYQPSDCENGICKKYVLKAYLEKEATFERRNR